MHLCLVRIRLSKAVVKCLMEAYFKWHTIWVAWFYFLWNQVLFNMAPHSVYRRSRLRIIVITITSDIFAFRNFSQWAIGYNFFMKCVHIWSKEMIFYGYDNVPYLLPITHLRKWKINPLLMLPILRYLDLQINPVENCNS